MLDLRSPQSWHCVSRLFPEASRTTLTNIRYSHGFLFPSTVADIRDENTTGLHPSIIAARGGLGGVDTYSTVAKFGTTYRPIVEDMSAIQQVEALIEGSPLSQVASMAVQPPDGQENHQVYSKPSSLTQRIAETFASRPSRVDRFLGDPQERGGTVVVHYIKKPDWFVETMIAFLGTADEQGHQELGTMAAMQDMSEYRVLGGGNGMTGLTMGKDGGL